MFVITIMYFITELLTEQQNISILYFLFLLTHKIFIYN